MGKIVCFAGNGPEYIWAYCPSFAAAMIFVVLFGLTSCAHIFQAIMYRKPFAMVLIMGALWETGGYVARIISIENQHQSGVYTVQLLLILLAPLWINAYIYMLLGRMIHFFLPKGEDKVYKIRARSITRMFVLFDITAFIVQAAGGTMTGPGSSAKVQKTGLNIYTGGVGIQLFFLVIFVSLAVGLQRKINALKRSFAKSGYIDEESRYEPMTLPGQSEFRVDSPSPELAGDLKLTVPLLRLVYVTLGLIILRNIYRLVEFGIGMNSPTVTHEWYSYVFDAVPMFFALIILNVFYPGKYLKGERADFSVEDKERKLMKKEVKQQKKEDKLERKAAKKEKKGNAKYEVLNRSPSPLP
ncbi:hypothetical protein H2200_005041 [Cladophialophora chaetospira]|uniref:RTA1 domain protein n=1 Tax=Cladophialophora chaetospira TaxID=386627 RepID=A0AA38XBV9_9EURO|nr:hypothetical protein H2200_005041 [Cladophialophora chaetospira]